jgi:hypothetical protein
LEKIGVDGSIRKWILKKQDGKAWTGLIWPRRGGVVACFECASEPPGSIKCEEFLDYQRKYQLLKKDSAPWSWLITEYQFPVSTAG